MLTLFWTLLGAVLWTYLGYPALLVVLARVRSRARIRTAVEPSVTIIISAFNEEKHIARKLENTLALRYPKQKLEVIVASDCSTDNTHEIVRGFADRGVKLAILPERGGKTAAQNLAASEAKGEVFIFTDATTEFGKDAIRGIVETFADPTVGCVGAELDYVSESGNAVGKGAGAYWRYEKKIKELEDRVNSLIGVSGCLYAVRAAAFKPIEPDLISDYVIAGDVYSRGYVTVYGHGAVSQEKTHEDSGKEFEMRVRVIIRTINALVRRAYMLNPFRHGFFAFQIFSHKVLRYLVAELLIGILVIGVWLCFYGGASAPIYQILTAGQFALYAAALVGWLSVKLNIKIPLVHIPFYFVVANLAALVALIQYLGGERKVVWTTHR